MNYFNELDEINKVENVTDNDFKRDREAEKSDYKDLTQSNNWWHNMDNQFTLCSFLINNNVLKTRYDVYFFFQKPWKYTEKWFQFNNE